MVRPSQTHRDGWKPFLKYPTTALKAAGLLPWVQELPVEDQTAMVSTLIQVHAIKGTEVPEHLSPPKKRRTAAPE